MSFYISSIIEKLIKYVIAMLDNMSMKLLSFRLLALWMHETCNIEELIQHIRLLGADLVSLAYY